MRTIDGDTALRYAGMKLGDRALIGPEVVQVDLTDLCPNNCVGCWARSPFLRDGDRYDTLEQGEMEPPLAFRLIDELARLRVREVFLAGGGDPTCYKHLVDFVGQVKAAGMRCTVNTSFVCTKNDQLDGLCDVGLDHLIASVWAGNANTYARQHPNKSEQTFAIVTAFLERIVARRSAGLPVPTVKIYQVVNNLNYRELREMIDYARDVDADEVEFSVFDPIPGRTSMFTLTQAQIGSVNKFFENLTPPERPFVHSELMLRRLNEYDADKGVFDNGIVASIPCAAGWFYSRITTMGLVNGCLKAHRVPTGNVRESGVAPVWFSDKHNEFRRETKTIRPDSKWLTKNIGHDVKFPLPGCFRICDNLGQNQAIMRRHGGLTPEDHRLIDTLAAKAKGGMTREAIVAEADRLVREDARHAEAPGLVSSFTRVQVNGGAANGKSKTGDDEGGSNGAGGATNGGGNGNGSTNAWGNGGTHASAANGGAAGVTPVAFVTNPRIKRETPAIESTADNALVLAGDLDVLHEHLDAIAPRFDVAVARLAELGERGRVRVPVTSGNVFRLREIAELVAARAGRSIGDGELCTLSPTPLSMLPKRAGAFLDATSRRLAAAGIDLEIDRDEIMGVLRAASVASGVETERLRALGVTANRAFVGPRTFHLDVTNTCNTDCVQCWFHSPYAKNRPDAGDFDIEWKRRQMPWDTFTRIVDDLADMRAGEDVVLSGKGEPTVHPRIADMVRYVKSKGLFATLFTNGIRLDAPLARAIVESRCDMVYVSLMADAPDTYARLHESPPAGEFERVVENIANLVREKRAAKADAPRIVLVDVVCNRNHDRVIEFARLGASLGVDILRYQLTAIESYNKPLSMTAGELARVRRDLSSARGIARDAGMSIVENIDLQLARGEENWSGDRYLREGCFAGWSFSRVWAGGEVSFCCAPKVIANLNDARFADVWTSRDYDRARIAGKLIDLNRDYKFQNGETLFNAICTRCPNYEGVERLRDVMRQAKLPSGRAARV
ncbi:radical SAM protein [bacterium]|nr:radical SAM protein [bacterium]